MLFTLRTKLLTLPGVSLALYLMSMPAAGQSESDAVLARLDGLMAGIRTMTADVVQLIVEADGGVLEESAIRMKLKRPDGFYWETVEPFPELVVTDGRYLWNYQPDLEQVVVEDWDASRSDLAAQLLSGNTQELAADYRMSVRDTGDSVFTEFVLDPLDAENVYRQIVLTFNGQQLDMIYVDNNNGQKTVWQFQDIVLNPALTHEEFVFVPTDDIEVIQNTYVQ